MLMVDYHPLNHKLMTKWLTDYGVCFQASNGLHAIREYHLGMMKGEPYDLFIIDKNEVNRVYNHIRDYEKAFGLDKDLKFMVSTEENQINNDIKKNKLYLVKPIEKEDLKEAMVYLGYK